MDHLLNNNPQVLQHLQSFLQALPSFGTTTNGVSIVKPQADNDTASKAAGTFDTATRSSAPFDLPTEMINYCFAALASYERMQLGIGGEHNPNLKMRHVVQSNDWDECDQVKQLKGNGNPHEGDLGMDMATRHITRGGDKVPKEFTSKWQWVEHTHEPGEIQVNGQSTEQWQFSKFSMDAPLTYDSDKSRS